MTTSECDRSLRTGRSLAQHADGDEALRRLAAARTRLVLGADATQVFFAVLALRLLPRIDETIDTMATDGRHLFLNPQFVRALTMDELQGVLAHEVLHNALAHHCRRGGREAERWNIACDLAINPLLLQAGLALPRGRLAPGEGPYAALPAGKSAEEYYSWLPETGAPSGGHAGKETADPGRCGAVKEPGDSSPANIRQDEAEWQVALAQARQLAQQRGRLPAGLARLVEGVLQPKVDWRGILREFVSEQARNDYCWSPPNRRFLHAGLYLPGLRSEDLGHIVLAIDTSGSIGAFALNRFAAEASSILEAFDAHLTIVYHDSAVQKVQTWQRSDGPLRLEPIGGGGTSHRCVFDWLDRQPDTPRCVVCLTDLHTEFPESSPPLPVLWGVTGSNRNVPPFGRCVYVD